MESPRQLLRIKRSWIAASVFSLLSIHLAAAPLDLNSLLNANRRAGARRNVPQQGNSEPIEQPQASDSAGLPDSPLKAYLDRFKQNSLTDKFRPQLPPLRLIEWLLVEGRIEEAQEEATKLAGSESADNREIRIDALTLQGAGFWLQDKQVEARQSLSQAVEAARSANRPDRMVRAGALLSLCSQNEDPVGSLNAWQSALEAGVKGGASIELARAFNIAGIAQYKARNPVEAQEAWDAALKALPKGPEAALDRAVCLHNAATFRMAKAIFERDPSPLVAQAEGELGEAVSLLRPGSLASDMVASIELQLARAADYRDDQAGGKKHAEAFRALVQGMSRDKLRELRFLQGAHFAIGSDGGQYSSPPRVVRTDQSPNYENSEFKVKERYQMSPGPAERRLADEDKTGQSCLTVIARAEDWQGRYTDGTVSDPMAKQIEQFKRMGLPPEKIEQMRQVMDQMRRGVDNAMATNQQMSRAMGAMTSFDEDEILAALPGSGRLPCQQSGSDALAVFQPGGGGGIRAKISESLPGLYDLDKIPDGKLYWLLALCGKGSRTFDAMAARDIDVIGSLSKMVLPGLHACNFDRSVWQLTELSGAMGWNSHERMVKTMAARSADEQKRLVHVCEDSYLALLEYDHQLKSAQNSHSTASGGTLELADKAKKASEGWMEAKRKLLEESAVGSFALPKLEDVSALLAPDEVYCQIHSDLNEGDAWYVSCIWSDTPGATPTMVTERISVPVVLAQEFRSGVFGGEAQLSAEAVAEKGRRIFRRLFTGSIRERVIRARGIVLAPSMQAWTLPYAAMVFNDSGEPQFLGLEKRLTLVESLSHWQHVSRPWSNPGGKALVVGGVEYNRVDQRKSLLRYGISSLNELDQSRRASEQIAGFYSTALKSGLDAEEGTIREVISEAPILHIASHGYTGFTVDRPMGRQDLLLAMRGGTPGVWLTPKPDKDVPELGQDGLLQAWEVRYELQMHADLVVLAACDTGRARAFMSNGPELPMAFLYAGARSVVAPLTQVEDRSAAKLLLDFHRNLRQGLAKDESLRRAMLEMRQASEFRHPYHWATFALFGATRNNLAGTSGK